MRELANDQAQEEHYAVSSQDGIDRLEFLRRAGGTVAGVGALAAGFGVPSALAASARERLASKQLSTVKILGPDSSALNSWNGFTKSTGMSLSWTNIPDQMGVITQKVINGGGADQYDLLNIDGGLQKHFVAGGYILPLDTGKITGFAKIPAAIRHNRPMSFLNGRQYGLPCTYNADSFGYYPKILGKAATWKVIFDDNRTLHKVAMEDNWQTSFVMAAMYLKWHHLAKINDPANMTPAEAHTTANFLITRKKAGQFRALWQSWQEALQLLGSKEVIAMSTWEPAVVALQDQGKEVLYAEPKEGYFKWMYDFFVPRSVKKNGSTDSAYKAMSWFMGGEYGANIIAERGYAPARPDLAVAYAKAHPDQFSSKQLQRIEQKYAEVLRKFRAPLVWENTVPDHQAEIEAEWERFKSA